VLASGHLAKKFSRRNYEHPGRSSVIKVFKPDYLFHPSLHMLTWLLWLFLFAVLFFALVVRNVFNA